MSIFRAGLAVVLAVFAVGCGAHELIAIPGTTTRVEVPTFERDMDYALQIFHNVDECDGARIPEEQYGICLPHVDRASGEVRLGYRFLDGDDYIALPEHGEQLEVSFQGTSVTDGRDGQEVEIIPHDPAFDSGTLYVLLIDGSGSMNTEDGPQGQTRMKQVKKALQRPDVIDAFFPGNGVNNAVILLQFTQGKPVGVGGAFEVLDSKAAYKRGVRQLQVLNGYTHLYDAIRYSTGAMLEQDAVQRGIGLDQRSVTVVALTDGFNNIRASDTCKDNAPRLKLLLDHLDTVRKGDVRRRPTVHTVGLGRPIRPGFEVPQRMSELSPRVLCGKRHVDTRIDGDLENRGIDNASLSLIARRGGGQSHVKRGKKGLGDAFRAAAAPKYRWFELRYRMDPFFLRRSFETKLRLVGVGTAEGGIKIHPSAWLDAPPGRLRTDGWHEEESYLRTFLVIVPVLGVLVVLSFLGAALHNTRRLLMGRVGMGVERETTPEGSSDAGGAG